MSKFLAKRLLHSLSIWIRLLQSNVYSIMSKGVYSAPTPDVSLLCITILKFILVWSIYLKSLLSSFLSYKNGSDNSNAIIIMPVQLADVVKVLWPGVVAQRHAAYYSSMPVQCTRKSWLHHCYYSFLPTCLVQQRKTVEVVWLCHPHVKPAMESLALDFIMAQIWPLTSGE